VRFATHTLAYPRSHWVQVDGLDRHWNRATVDAEILEPSALKVSTHNVSGLTLRVPMSRLDPTIDSMRVHVDEDAVDIPIFRVTDGSPQISLHKRRGHWKRGALATSGPRKNSVVHGPIDDAFTRRFLMVRPTGPAMNDTLGRWVEAEMYHALEEWRAQFRGEARVRDDVELTEADIRTHDLILWGDPESNRMLRRILGKLPLRWTSSQLRFQGERYLPDEHLPVLIYPNPLNPDRYIVLNSGFTFSEFGHQSNSLQTPKLPDWAVVNMTVPRPDRLRNGIAAAGFFDERWR